ncbi:hypothetical protein CTAYLR_006164 [Chrysophaeum taylorii]|uniref:Phytase-like domain-containing protein n=1 Tax=Chrysophaeum taylorii TaxID=2483200 RepID=A0AAD7UPW5_9STRA|nr:hypothetical protein CTAYLR_006164 [Chrysophaeum taylorii]
MRLLLQTAAAAAGFQVRSVRYARHWLFPVGYTFEGNNLVSEISACRFVELDRVALVGDDGEVFTARIDANNITFESRVPLAAPGYTYLDSEGCALAGDTLLVSTEQHGDSPLAVTPFSIETGRALDSPVFEIPDVVLEGVLENKGFEALATTSVWGDDRVAATTETPLRDEDFHRVLLWDLGGGAVLQTLEYRATMPVVEFESLVTSLLVLERQYVQKQNTIRLFEVDENMTKRQLFEWTVGGGLETIDESYDLPVDNYEGMCLYPDGRRLLLVNDDNNNPNQIGTQFVELEFDFFFNDLSSHPSPFPSPAPTPLPSLAVTPTPTPDRRRSLWLLSILICGAIAAGGIAFVCYSTRPLPAVDDDDADHIELSYDVAVDSKRDQQRVADFSRLPSADPEEEEGDDDNKRTSRSIDLV